ncbi:hypothetical protein [Streptomyces fructofermentans]|uniref:hypothetical protein n=1 Tax=Streptomyces fructofermentans TaxID=152141 RepID=UPI0037AF95E8
MSARTSGAPGRVARTLVAASVMTALGGLAACGGGTAKDRKPSGPSGTASGAAAARDGGSAAPAGDGAEGPLNKARLTKAVLGTGDLKGYGFTESGAADLQGQSLRATPVACQPVADLFLFTTDPSPRAVVSRHAEREDDREGADASVHTLALLSYRAGEAHEVMAGLRASVRTCARYEHAGYTYGKVEAVDGPDLGDESVALRLVGSIEGAEVPTAYTVVRDGTTLAAFSSMDMLDADGVEVPGKLVRAQLAKLRKSREADGPGTAGKPDATSTPTG